MKTSINILVGVVSSLVLTPLVLADGPAIHGGLNMANVSITPSTSTNSTVGFVIGGSYQFGLHENFALEPGLQFAQRGYEYSVVGITFSAKYNYLEIPLLLKARLPSGSITPFVLFGPNFGVKVGTDCSISGAGANTSCTVTGDSSTNFGLDLGGGIDFAVGTGTALFELRYHLGLTDANTAPSAELKHRGLMILAGYRF